MVTGRVGSGIAAELGSMVVTEQINALRALGTDPSASWSCRACWRGWSWCPALTAVSNGVGMAGA